jgi:NAD(P)-dependent dehydrogenase (short-subunit alcohol dehydrogenase family)
VINRNIQVYSLCPGYVNTDMTSHKGVLTIQQGALTPIFLIDLPFEVN